MFYFVPSREASVAVLDQAISRTGLFPFDHVPRFPRCGCISPWLHQPAFSMPLAHRVADDEKFAMAENTENDAEKTSSAAQALPRIVWALVGKFSWWVTRGVVGSVSHGCNFHSEWGRLYSWLVRNNSSKRMQIWLKRITENPRYCSCCEMLLNRRQQYLEHMEGKKHFKAQRRHDGKLGISTTRQRDTPEAKQNRIGEARRRRLGAAPDPYLAEEQDDAVPYTPRVRGAMGSRHH